MFGGDFAKENNNKWKKFVSLNFQTTTKYMIKINSVTVDGILNYPLKFITINKKVNFKPDEILFNFSTNKFKLMDYKYFLNTFL